MKRAVLAGLGLALLAGCASTPDLPPKAGPEEVQVYDPNAGQFPPEGYRTIGPVETSAPLGTATPDLIMALRTEAARLGADAIIVQSIRQTTEGEVSAAAAGREERVIARALAVYWPTAEQTP